MKNYFLQILVLFCFSGCEKSPEDNYTFHEFWFDKATQDSLLKHGCKHVLCYLTCKTEDGEIMDEICEDTTCSMIKICKSEKIVQIKRLLKKGEKQFISYKILYMDGPDKKVIGTSIKNWAGSIELEGGLNTNTQLRW